MNLDELAAAIRSTSPEEPAQRLADLLIAWKGDDTTAEDLKSSFERAIGYTWLSTDAIHSAIYRHWSEFREGAIDGIGGMTMNERLHWFGLFERFGEAKTDEERARVYAKLHASP